MFTMPSQVKNWYILSKGKRLGPVSEETLISFYEQKKINGDTKVIKAGMKAWISLSASGILEPEFDEADLPPLPVEKQKKKPKAVAIIGCIAVIAVGIFGIVYGLSIILPSSNRNTTPSYVADDNSILPSSESELVGVWKAIINEEIYCFRNDGTFSFFDANTPIIEIGSGIYTIERDKLIATPFDDSDHLEEPHEFLYQIIDGNLVLTSVDSFNALIFIRQSEPTLVANTASGDSIDMYANVLSEHALLAWAGNETFFRCDYAFYDIDANGVQELFLRYESDVEVLTVIYTYANGKERKLGQFEPPFSEVSLDDSGNLYCRDINLFRSLNSIMRISADGETLFTTEAWERTSDFNLTEAMEVTDASQVYTYTSKNGMEIISSSEYSIALDNYFDPNPHFIDSLNWQLLTSRELSTESEDPTDIFAYVLDLYAAEHYIYCDYAFYDINSDGVDELLIRYSDRLDEYIHLYTYANGKTNKIGEFWSRSRLSLDQSGNLYNEGSSGAANSSYHIMRISADGTSLVTIEAWEVNYPIFTHISVDGVEAISEREFFTALESFDPMPNLLNSLNWQPLATNGRNDSTMAIRGHSLPPDQNVGAIFGVRGVIESNYIIRSVTVDVYNDRGISETGATAYPNAYSYDIKALDYDILFDSLTPGYKTYVIIATDEAVTKTLVSHAFMVYATGENTHDQSINLFGDAWFARVDGLDSYIFFHEDGTYMHCFLGVQDDFGLEITGRYEVSGDTITCIDTYGYIYMYYIVGNAIYTEDGTRHYRMLDSLR